jgi:hypothetical protein
MDSRFRTNNQELTTETATGDPASQADALLGQAGELVHNSAQVLGVIDSTLSQNSDEFLMDSQQHSGQ